MIIVGAGLAGLIAARIFPQAEIIESQGAPVEAHKALLRFRSDAVARVTGIDFRRVEVHKGIWHEGQYMWPDIQLANMYSQKCLGRTLSRSIWNLDTVERFVAPPEFYERLVEGAASRISWGTDFDFAAGEQQVVSTAPLPVVLREVGISHDLTFDRSPVTVQRFHVPCSDVYQTVYFPSRDHSMYRASITGNLLIVEFVGQPTGEWVQELSQAFALPDNTSIIEEVSQRYGKIAPVDEQKRKALVARLSHDHDIFSLGRFATWRNLLLDDVVKDSDVVKRLMTASTYDRKLAAL